MSDYPVVMAIHAAISRRNWNEVERAANNLRDYEQPKWKQATDRIEALEADFNSAAAAASEYSEFWERHHGDFDQFGNYVPYSQMDGDLRAANARIEELTKELRKLQDIIDVLADRLLDLEAGK
jgi:DNA repair exonuclease SbcCD ATPase subunit